ncbi:MAG TPA: hypothetical protein VHS31_07595 [Tepidisphaeraceae bacterium]|nr:hypothetical protein [Tepidisphaeraceae bacterium]
MTGNGARFSDGSGLTDLSPEIFIAVFNTAKLSVEQLAQASLAILLKAYLTQKPLKLS